MRIELVGHAIERFGVCWCFTLDGDVRPDLGVVDVELQPAFKARLGVGLDRLGRTFRFADTAIDAFVRVDDEHVLALVEAIHRADFDAIHVLALDAIIGDHIGHRPILIVIAPCFGWAPCFSLMRALSGSAGRAQAQELSRLATISSAWQVSGAAINLSDFRRAPALPLPGLAARLAEPL